MLGKEKNRETFGSDQVFKKALELDANYSQAYACLGFAHMFDYQNRWSDNPDESLRSPRNTHKRRSTTTRTSRWRDGAAALARDLTKRTSIGRRPKSIGAGAESKFRIGAQPPGAHSRLQRRPLEAIPAIEQAMRLDPAFRQQFLHFLGIAYLRPASTKPRRRCCGSGLSWCRTRIFPAPYSRRRSVTWARWMLLARCGAS